MSQKAAGSCKGDPPLSWATHPQKKRATAPISSTHLGEWHHVWEDGSLSLSSFGAEDANSSSHIAHFLYYYTTSSTTYYNVRVVSGGRGEKVGHRWVWDFFTLLLGNWHLSSWDLEATCVEFLQWVKIGTFTKKSTYVEMWERFGNMLIAQQSWLDYQS